MEITLNIPEEFGRRLMSEGKDPARVALEAFALEGYRSRIFYESDLCRMLGLQSRLDVHAFLKEHGVYLQYGLGELEQDEANTRSLREEVQRDMASRHARQK